MFVSFHSGCARVSSSSRNEEQSLNNVDLFSFGFFSVVEDGSHCL